MSRYILGRLIYMLFVAFIVSIIVFGLMNVLPGDPAMSMLGPNATPEELAKMRESLGLNDSLPIRYAKWIGGVLHGDLGKSLVTRYAVSDLLKERLPATMELGALSLVLTLLIALPIGIYSALRPNSLIDIAATTIAISVAATPAFWLGIALILVFGLWLRVLPTSGFVPFGQDPLGNLRHMVLPVVTLGLTSSVMVMRQTRSAMLEIMHQDYIRTAHMKGLRERVVVFRHALRNALIPVITVFGFQVGVIFGGAVVIETVFSIPGMGRLLVDSIRMHRDYPVVQSVTFLLSFVVLIVNLLVDLSYAIIDPRIRYNK